MAVCRSMTVKVCRRTAPVNRLAATRRSRQAAAMCNEAARRIALHQLREDWSETRIELVFPEGLPNMAPLDSIRITDPSVIIRAADRGAEFGGRSAPGTSPLAELLTRRWSWPGPGGKPVYNFRSDGRRLDRGRCLIPVSAFYEHTDPPEGSPKKTPKAKWSFAMAGREWFCIAGLWRADVPLKEGGTGEAWTMLTCPPGPDVAPYHARQVVVLGPDQWARWLDPAIPSAALCRPAPAGTLVATRVR